MPTLVNTYGARDANSFVTLADASSIIESSQIYFDEWVLANTIQREISLVKAARQITNRRWAGRKWFPYQALAFPRLPEGRRFPSEYGGSADPGEEFFDFVASDRYQQEQRERVSRAQAYQALHVLKHGGEDAHREDFFKGLGGQSRGYRMSESWSYREPSFVLSPDVWDELSPYRASGPKLVRGGGAPSSSDYPME